MNTWTKVEARCYFDLKWMLFACLATLACTGNLIGQDFMVEGVLTSKLYAYSRCVEQTDFRLQANIRSPGWLLRLDELQTGPSRTKNNYYYGRYVVGSDGRSEVALELVENSSPWLKTNNITALGIITHDPIPTQFVVPGSVFAWLTTVPDAWRIAFHGDAGRCVWDDETALKHELTLRVSTDSRTNGSSVERFVIWHNNGKVRYEDDFGSLRSSELMPPYNRGFTNAVYSCVLTNYQGVLMPIAAKLTVFGPDIASVLSPGSTTMEMSYGLNITRCIPGCEKSAVTPQLAGKAAICDARIANAALSLRNASLATNAESLRICDSEDLYSSWPQGQEERKVARKPFATMETKHFRHARFQVGAVLLCFSLLGAWLW